MAEWDFYLDYARNICKSMHYKNRLKLVKETVIANKYIRRCSNSLINLHQNKMPLYSHQILTKLERWLISTTSDFVGNQKSSCTVVGMSTKSSPLTPRGSFPCMRLLRLDMLKHKLMGFVPRVSDLGGLRWGLRICSSSQVMPLLLGVDHFENH